MEADSLRMRACWPAGRAQALVSAQLPGEADKNGRTDRAACPVDHLPDGRDGSLAPTVRGYS